MPEFPLVAKCLTFIMENSDDTWTAAYHVRTRCRHLFLFHLKLDQNGFANMQVPPEPELRIGKLTKTGERIITDCEVWSPVTKYLAMLG